jgi:hypothetical protein
MHGTSACTRSKASGNLAVQIAAVRRVLGQKPGGENWIETLPRRGYWYIGPIGAAEDESSVTVAMTEAAPALSDRPRWGSTTVVCRHSEFLCHEGRQCGTDGNTGL